MLGKDLVSVMDETPTQANRGTPGNGVLPPIFGKRLACRRLVPYILDKRINTQTAVLRSRTCLLGRPVTKTEIHERSLHAAAFVVGRNRAHKLLP